MKLFPYREETDPEMIRAGEAAYREAPPTHNTRRNAFARRLTHNHSEPLPGPAGTVERCDKTST